MPNLSRSLPEPYAALLSKLLERALEVLGEKLVSFVVYGSVARGEAERDSDVDLLLVVDGLPRSRLRRQELFMEVEEGVQAEVEKLRAEGYNVDFSPIIKTPGEAAVFSPVYLDMVEDAVILHDKDGFFRGVLDRLRGRLRDLGAERVRLGKRWYWRLKRDYKFGEVIEV
ncbi:MAG: nucleotidyltransferase domain-containing protein [Candidatus Nezhaarchaeota archaeon]|nr:nucleotidyltransferase domain-containing protein [Candidatus Nezhaarchaeota archaeon]